MYVGPTECNDSSMEVLSILTVQFPAQEGSILILDINYDNFVSSGIALGHQIAPWRKKMSTQLYINVYYTWYMYMFYNAAKWDGQEL